MHRTIGWPALLAPSQNPRSAYPPLGQAVCLDKQTQRHPNWPPWVAFALYCSDTIALCAKPLVLLSIGGMAGIRERTRSLMSKPAFAQPAKPDGDGKPRTQFNNENALIVWRKIADRH
jgi:hypothetical protein